MTDEIESPAHYNFGQMEAREIIELAIADFRDPTTVYHVASALKYLLRASRKNGADDIAKARKHVGWAEDAARASERRRAVFRAEDCGPAFPQCASTGDAAFRHGDIDKVCGIRDAGEFTQPPNCAHPMHAVALEMAEAAIPKRHSESAWGVTWPELRVWPDSYADSKSSEPQTEYQTLVGN